MIRELRRSRRATGLALAMAGVLSLLATGSLLGQSGTRRDEQPRPRPAPRPTADDNRAAPVEAPAPLEVRLWNYLQSAKYGHWAALPGKPAGTYAGESPHGAQVKLYASRGAVADPLGLPNGTILVKENYAADQKTLMAITVMYRAQGFDPEHNDWFWAKYEPNGRVSRMNNMSVAGRIGMCIECHSSAGGHDFVFANDESR